MPLVLLLIAALWIVVVWLLFRSGAARPRRRSAAIDLAAAGGLLALTLAFFWRTLTGDVYQPADGGDLVSFLFPTYRFAARTLAEGSLPLWNPHLYGGTSFINDIQAGFFYLPNLLLFLLWPDFPYPVMQWLSVLHLWWAGVGMYLLVRSLRPGNETVHPLAAFFGGVVFAFCDPLLMHIGNLNLIAVLAWLPWVMAAFHRALERRSLRWAAVAGLLFAVSSYAGHAQSSLLIGLSLAVYAVAWLAIWLWKRDAEEDKRERWYVRLSWTVGVLATTGILAVMLLAPILVPALEGVRESVRTDFTYQESVAYSLAPAQMVGLLSPGFFGRGPALHWSLWDRVELPYLGVPALIMAIAALWIAPVRRRRDLYPWLVVAAFGLLVALGIYGILHGVLTAIVPFFDQLRAPARTLILFALGGSVLAAVGLDVVMKSGVPSGSGFMAFLKWGSILLAGVFVPLLLAALAITQSADELFLRASLALLAMALAAAAWLFTWLLVAARNRERLSPLLFGTLMVVLLFLELAAAGAYTDISSDDPTAKYHHPEIEAFLRADADVFRIDTLTDIDDLWQPDTAALLGFEDVGGIANPLMRADWAAYWESTGGRDTTAYNALNVKYLIARDGTPLPDNWELALDAPDALSVWRNTSFVPRAWFVPEGGDLMDGQASNVPIDIQRWDATGLQYRFQSPSAGTLVTSERWADWYVDLNDGGTVVAPDPARTFTLITIPSAGNQIITMRFGSYDWQIRWWAWLGVACAGLTVAAILIAKAKGRISPATPTAER